MKKLSLIFFGVLAIMMAGCSKDVPMVPEEDAWVNDLSLPVPIEFGNIVTSIPNTKAGAIENATDFVNKNVRFGVFGVDVDAENWQRGADSVLLYNEVAQYVDEDGVGQIGFRANNTVVTYYYPTDVRCNYTFYAYHTYVSAAGYESAETIGGGYYVPVTFGDVDVLWAKAEVTDDDIAAVGRDGYNAAYCRAARKQNLDERMPVFKFSHLTSALYFNVVADRDDDLTLTDDDFKSVAVTAIRVTDAYQTAKLCVAHKDVIYEKTWSGKSGVGVTMSGIPDGGVVPTLGGVKAGNGLFLCPQDKFTIEIDVLAPYNGSTRTTTLQRVVDLEGSGGFKAGHKYEFDIKLKAPEELVIRIVATKFEEGTLSDPIFNEDDAI